MNHTEYLCDFNTVTCTYVYLKIWGQMLEDGVAILTIIISCIWMLVNKLIKFHKD